MNQLNVVIDTNVLVAALKSQLGASYKLLNLLPNGVYRPNVSVPLFIEYESALKRLEIITGLSFGEIDDILDYFLSCSNLREIYYLWRPYLKDPKDDLVLEVAVESKSSHIVTFNKKDFKGVEKFGIQLGTPQEFMIERGLI